MPANRWLALALLAIGGYGLVDALRLSLHRSGTFAGAILQTSAGLVVLWVGLAAAFAEPV